MNRGAGTFIATVWTARGVFGSIVPCVDDGALFYFLVYFGHFLRRVRLFCMLVCMSRQSTNFAHSYRNPIVPFRAFLHLLRVSILTNKLAKIVDCCPNQRRPSGVRLVSQSPL